MNSSDGEALRPRDVVLSGVRQAFSPPSGAHAFLDASSPLGDVQPEGPHGGTSLSSSKRG